MLNKENCKRFQVFVNDVWIDCEMFQLVEGDVYRTLHPVTGEPLHEGSRTVTESTRLLSHVTGAEPEAFSLGDGILQPVANLAGFNIPYRAELALIGVEMPEPTRTAKIAAAKKARVDRDSQKVA